MENATTKVVTGLVRLSYVHIFKPEVVGEGDEPKYSVSVIIPKSDKITLKKIKAAVDAAKEQGKTTKFNGKIPAKLKLPLRDGDEEREDDPAYKNSYFINASGKRKPGIVDRNCNEILDAEEVYSGCYGRVSINFYPFNTKGNMGIAAGLNNVQKLKEGEPLSGGSTPEEDFEDEYEDEDDDDFDPLA